MTTVHDRCLHRLEWERSQEQARQKAEDEVEQEQVQMAMIDWHDFVMVETIEFADDEDGELPHPMTVEEVIRRPKMSAVEEEVFEPVKDVEMEMEEDQLVQEEVRAASLDENDNENKKEPEPSMRIVKNWKRPEVRIPAEIDPTKVVISPVTGEMIPINEMAEHMRISLIDPKNKEQKDRMMAKIWETTLAHDDEISSTIAGLARTRPDIFGTTEEEVSSAVKGEIEKKKEEQPKQVIWDGHTGSIGRTANQVMSQSLPAPREGQFDSANNEARNLPGPAPPPNSGMPSIRPPPPPPPRLASNIPPIPTCTGILNAPPPRMAVVAVIPPVRPQPPPLISLTRLPPMVRPAASLPISVAIPSVPVPPPRGSQFTPIPAARPFVPMHMPHLLCHPWLLSHLCLKEYLHRHPRKLLLHCKKNQSKGGRVDEIVLIPEGQFLAQHPGSIGIFVSVPNVDEGNLKGQILEISMQSLAETIGSLKEKTAGEVQLPASKQKLSGHAGFLKESMSLAYYNIGPGETLTLSLRECGGRKR